MGSKKKTAAKPMDQLFKGLENMEAPGVVQEWLDDEFPFRASLLDMDRRTMLKMAGGAALLAGIGGCRYQAPRKIVPFVQQADNAVAGQELSYATCATLNGFAHPLMAIQRDGRPVRLDPHTHFGKGLQPAVAAEILNLYDPDRLKAVQYRGVPSSWNDAVRSLTEALQRSKDGTGVAVLSEPVHSPTLGRLAKEFLAKYPKAKWFQYEASAMDNARSGSLLAFGADLLPVYQAGEADVIVSIDCDLTYLGTDCGTVARDVASRRVPQNGRPMSRIYAFESHPSPFGVMADHRMRVKPSEAVGLLASLGAKLGVPGSTTAALPASVDQRHFDAMAADVSAARGRCLVVVGAHLEPAAHAAAHAINEALGAFGKTVSFVQNPQPMPASNMGDLQALATMLSGNQVSTFIALGGNPVYAAPADIPLGELMAKADVRACLATHEDETCFASDWQLPAAHFLESWSDGTMADGTVVSGQPIVEKLYDGKSAIELIDLLLGGSGQALDAVRRTHTTAGFDWNSFLAFGHDRGQRATFATASVVPNLLGSLPTAPAATGMELLIVPDRYLLDGRNANNNWLQETPRPVTNLTWDNALLVGKATADKLGVKAPYDKKFINVPYYGKADMVTVTVEGRTLKVPVWVNPGQADDVLVLHMGYGRTRGGAFAAAGSSKEGGGFDANKLRSAKSPNLLGNVQVSVSGGEYALANTQHHNTIDVKVEDSDRMVYLSTTLEELEHPEEHAEAHEPEDFNEFGKGHEASMYDGSDFAADFEKNYQWAMAIDLALCNGCNACVTACQAENNIPTVGKESVQKGRELHWIRVDRYYRGGNGEFDPNNPPIVVQPVTCMHCEQAPCEPVCPVAATTHSAEGLNQMVYNRCVGTRYCSNNCPYKVRRFNFFHFSQRADQIPVLKMLQNPDVTVRFRGVMEKCTYCVQRINHARISAKKQQRPIADGEIQVACQVACPSGAIVFGDLKKPENAVAKARADKRNYAMLDDLDTRPRTTYLKRIANPNKEVEA